MPVNSLNAKESYRSLWLSPGTTGTVLLTMILDSYGPEFFDMEPAVYRMELEEGFGVEGIPQVNIDKIMGLWASLTTDLVHTDPSTFINTANALSNVPVDPRVFDPADPYESAWALTELSMLDPSSASRYSADIRRYLGEVCKAFGLYNPPAVIGNVADFGADDYAAAVESNATTPEEAQVMSTAQAEFRQDISAYVSRRVAQLLNELDKVPLLGRDKEAWSKFMERATQSLVTPRGAG